MDATTKFLTCARCRQPTRTFPEGILNGGMDMQPEAPFKARLAYKCIKCDRIFCACCCHPAAVVKEMLQPGRFSLPGEFEGAHPQAACPECRGMVRPFDKSKPLTLGQWVVVSLYASITLLIAVAALTQGDWFLGVLFLCGCVSGTAGILRVFAK